MAPVCGISNVDLEWAALACYLTARPGLSVSIVALVSEIWPTAISCFDVMITLFRRTAIACSSQVRFVAHSVQVDSC